MKALNNIMFICEATRTLDSWLNAIGEAETYEKARQKATGCFGFIDCMTVYCNTMICMENNDFTDDLGDTLESWTASVYQKMTDKAIETEQPAETVSKLLQKRDEHRI